MPYQNRQELPKEVKTKISADLQDVFIDVFNEVLKEDKSESRAFAQAWATVNEIRARSILESALLTSEAREVDLGTDRTQWIFVASPGDIVEDTNGKIMVLSESFLREIASNTQALYNDRRKAAAKNASSPVLNPIISEHREDSDLYGDVLDTKYATSEGKEGLWVKAKWTRPAAKKVENEEIRYVSMGIGPEKLSDRESVLYPVLNELSKTKKPMVKSIGNVQDTVSIQLNQKHFSLKETDMDKIEEQLEDLETSLPSDANPSDANPSDANPSDAEDKEEVKAQDKEEGDMKKEEVKAQEDELAAELQQRLDVMKDLMGGGEDSPMDEDGKSELIGIMGEMMQMLDNKAQDLMPEQEADKLEASDANPSDAKPSDDETKELSLKLSEIVEKQSKALEKQQEEIQSLSDRVDALNNKARLNASETGQINDKESNKRPNITSAQQAIEVARLKLKEDGVEDPDAVSVVRLARKMQKESNQ